MKAVSFWNITVAESRGAVRWQRFNGGLFLVTRLQRVYRARVRGGAVWLQPWWSI